MFIVVIVVAAGIWYFVLGGPSGSSSSVEDTLTKKPSNAFQVRVGSVQSDGSFRGQVEPADRQAKRGLEAIGTDERVTLRLADLEPLDPVRDECWAAEGQAAIKELIGGRIWVDPDDVDQQGRGTFLVYAWNADDVFVQEKLLRDGDARVFVGQVRPALEDVLAEAEEEAATAERGQWGTCAAQ